MALSANVVSVVSSVAMALSVNVSSVVILVVFVKLHCLIKDNLL